MSKRPGDGSRRGPLEELEIEAGTAGASLLSPDAAACQKQDSLGKRASLLHIGQNLFCFSPTLSGSSPTPVLKALDIHNSTGPCPRIQKQRTATSGMLGQAPLL